MTNRDGLQLSCMISVTILISYPVRFTFELKRIVLLCLTWKRTMKKKPCIIADETFLENSEEYTCYGQIIYTQQTTGKDISQNGTIGFSCPSDNHDNYTGIDHDCVCLQQSVFDVKSCDGKRSSEWTTPNKCSSGQCITWESKPIKLPQSCTNALVSSKCEVKCRIDTNKDKVLCKKTIKCTSSAADNSNSKKGIVCETITKSTTQNPSITSGNIFTSVARRSETTPTTTNTPITTTTSAVPVLKKQQSSHQGNGGSTITIALGVVAGFAIIALVVALVLVFFFHRRQRGRKTPSTNVYMDMNVSEVGSTTYESSVGIQKQCGPLEKECSNQNDRKSGLYMDLDDPTIGQSDQNTDQNYGTETMDNIYNSIDECEPAGDQGYAQAIDPAPRRSPGTASPVNVTATSANSFVLEKQEEEKSRESAKNLTEDLNPTEDYFVLDKDECRVTSDLIDNHTDSAIVNGNKADNYFILEEQANEQNPESVSSENYFLLEKENETDANEVTPIRDTYNTLNTDVTTDHTDDYSHARVVGSSQESTRDGPVTENSDDYDKLFHQPNNNVLCDSDNDYDHMNNDDLLTSL